MLKIIKTSKSAKEFIWLMFITFIAYQLLVSIDKNNKQMYSDIILILCLCLGIGIWFLRFIIRKILNDKNR